VRGRAAHAGLDPESGVSAILELSHVIQQLFELNDVERGVSVNVGTVEGGLAANVVAPESRAVVDVRVRTHEDARRIEQAIHALRAVSEDAELEIEGAIVRPPFEPSQGSERLWELAHGLALGLGVELQQGAAGGASDGNTTSAWTPTLDGLGAVGDGAHAHHEFVFVDKLAERTALLALIILSPALQPRSPSARGGS
jgi:glutamate carboxypeptidase